MDSHTLIKDTNAAAEIERMHYHLVIKLMNYNNKGSILVCAP